MTNTINPNESERLSALLDYQIMDTEESDAFDNLTELAANVCNASSAFVCLIDGERLWFKSRYNFEIGEIPRGYTFCDCAIENPGEILIVEDAAGDERFAASPMVTNEPHVRFYAGAPLVSKNGFALGTLCVIDYQPHRLTAEQSNALKLLAKQVVSQIELHITLRENDILTQQCHLALSQAADGIHLSDSAGRITAANPKYCELTGRTETELLGMNVRQLIHPERLEDLPKHLAELHEGKSILFESVILRPDNSLVPVEISSRKIGENIFQEIVRDISERKKVEKKLNDSESRFRDFVNNSLALFCTHDVEGTIESINPASAVTLGYAESELVGKNLNEILIPEAKNFLSLYLDEIKTKGEAHGLMEVLTKTGERRIWSYNNVLCGNGENRQYVLGSAQDITELKRGRDELRESQIKFDLFVDNNPAVIFIKDDKGRFVKINRSFEELFQVRLEDSKSIGDFEMFSPEIVEKLRANDRIVLETDETMIAVEFVPTPDGAPHYWLSHKFLIEDTSGNKFVGGIAVDITERKQLEDNLQAARDAALESARLKSAFLTNVSHEIRTPMNGVIGMTELLLDTPLDRTQREYAETIRQSGDALLTVINDILDLAKIEAGKLRFEAVDFDVREMVESTVESLAERASWKKIEIASLIEADVPPVLRGDPGRLRQVLTNLVGNAVKFTERGEIGVFVKVEKETADNLFLNFTVADTGIGITAENLKNLFQPFVQVDNSTTREFGGTGLGLAISKQIVEMMNGEITVKSELRQGSEFSFTVCFAKAQTSKTIRREFQNTNLLQFLSGKNILIADAGRMLRRTLRDYVSIWGLNAAAAADGEETLRKLKRAADGAKPFDIAVIDMNLADWEGFALARRIKSDAALCGTRIILTTAYGQRGDAAEAQNIGVSGYLTKPIRGAQLFDCLIAVFNENRQESESVHVSQTPPLVTRHSLREAKAQTDYPPEFSQNLSPRLLVVEDNETNRLVILRQLKQIGLTADVAFDGVEALEKLAVKNYQVILMDCQMPRLDGYETTREIRRLEREKTAHGEEVSPRTAIIALTAHTLAGEREKCLTAGMDDYLSKPIKINDLTALLKFWIKTDESPLENIETIQPGESPTESPVNFDSPAFTPATDSTNADFDYEIRQLFLSETERHISKLKQAVENGDCANVARLAHSIRGNSLAVGEASLAEKTELLEISAKANEIGKMSEMFRTFFEEFSRLRAEDTIINVSA